MDLFHNNNSKHSKKASINVKKTENKVKRTATSIKSSGKKNVYRTQFRASQNTNTDAKSKNTRTIKKLSTASNADSKARKQAHNFNRVNAKKVSNALTGKKSTKNTKSVARAISTKLHGNLNTFGLKIRDGFKKLGSNARTNIKHFKSSVAQGISEFNTSAKKNIKSVKSRLSNGFRTIQTRIKSKKHLLTAVADKIAKLDVNISKSTKQNITKKKPNFNVLSSKANALKNGLKDRVSANVTQMSKKINQGINTSKKKINSRIDTGKKNLNSNIKQLKHSVTNKSENLKNFILKENKFVRAFSEFKSLDKSEKQKTLRVALTPARVVVTAAMVIAFTMGVLSLDVNKVLKKNEFAIRNTEHEGMFYEMAFENHIQNTQMEEFKKFADQVNIFPLLTTYDLTSNSELMGRFPDVETPKAILSELVSLSDESFFEDIKYSYNEDVHIYRNVIPAYKLPKYDTHEEISNYVKSGQKESIKYTVVKGDYIEKIAAKFDVSTKDLIEINPVVLSKKYLNIGDELIIMRSKPLINAKLSYVQEYTETIESEVELQKNDKMYEGEQKVINEGEAGEQKVVARIIKNNGLVIDKKVLSSEVLKQPVKKVLMIGTKVAPIKLASTSIQSRSKRTYTEEPKELRGGLAIQSPLASYVITSRFGPRWGAFHQGIDLAVPSGTPVYAAEGGTVTVSTTSGRGYGHYIKINHGSGVSTIYAHCSTLLVEPGQQVAKGELIARSGNTGRSSGPHLHFEVLIDGSSQNPERYYRF